MNKKLKKYAARQTKNLAKTESLITLKEKQKEMRSVTWNKRKFIPLIVGTVFSVITIAVVLLCVFFIGSEDETNDTAPRVYLEENLSSQNITVEALNEELQYFTFVNGNYSINRFEDEDYGETLFYSVNFVDEDGLNQMDFVVAVNPNYNIEFEHKEYIKRDTVIGYAIEYVETYSEDEGLYFFTVKGEINIEEETVYIIAEIISFDEDSHFIEQLNRIIEKK